MFCRHDDCCVDRHHACDHCAPRYTTTTAATGPDLIDRIRAVPYAQVAWSTGLRPGAACHLLFICRRALPSMGLGAGPLPASLSRRSCHQPVQTQLPQCHNCHHDAPRLPPRRDTNGPTQGAPWSTVLPRVVLHPGAIRSRAPWCHPWSIHPPCWCHPSVVVHHRAGIIRGPQWWWWWWHPWSTAVAGGIRSSGIRGGTHMDGWNPSAPETARLR